MFVRIALVLAFAFSVILNPLLVIAGEVQKQPFNQEEIAVLEQIGGTELQRLARGEAGAIEKFSSDRGISAEKVGKALENMNDKDRNAILASSPEELDAIIAGEMEAGDVLLAALAAVGIFFIILVIAAS